MNYKAWLQSMVLSGFHLLYTLLFPSVLNGDKYLEWGGRLLEPSYIHAFFLSRIKFGEFARRPVTTTLIDVCQWMGLSLEWSFIWVLYIGLTCAFFCLYLLTRKLTNDQVIASWSMLLFALSFWVLHGFFTEQYAYDEPWQYTFVFLALIFLHAQRLIAFGAVLLLALICRESTLLLLPGIALFFVVQGPLWHRNNIIRLLKAFWSVPVYGAILWLIIAGKELEEKSSSYMQDVRFKHLFFSFENLDIGVVTLGSLFLSVALVLIAYRLRPTDTKSDLPWVNATVINFGLNAFITLWFTMGRETRIFAQPLLLMSPWLGYYLVKGWPRFKTALQPSDLGFAGLSAWTGRLMLFSALCFSASLLAYEVYWPTVTKFYLGFQHWMFIMLSLTALTGLAFTRSIESRQQLSHPFWLVFLIPIVLFFGRQEAFRAEGRYAKAVMEMNGESNKSPFVLVSSNRASIAQCYFNAKGYDALAGDFDFQLPIKQFLYRLPDIDQDELVYLEENPSDHFPFKYMLSRLGRAHSTRFGEHQATVVHLKESPVAEQHAYTYQPSQSQFIPQAAPSTTTIEFEGEYSHAFKANRSELGIDSIRSVTVRVDYQANLDSEGAVVVTIEGDTTNSWTHEYLNVYLVNTDGWNTAYRTAKLPAPTAEDVLISAYVWNPKGELITIRNFEVVINSPWVE